MTAITRFICRVVPAITFMFSGFVKAIDPVGGSLKLNDYFIAFNLEWLSPLSLPLAIILSSVEFLMGFYLLVGIFTRVAANAILGFMLFFTLLTLYVAIFNPVANCGCFGDAITLTNWETFWKNVIVLAFTIGMYLYRKQYSSLNNFRGYLTAGLVAIYVLAISVYAIVFQPIIDFRPFKVGNNIHDLMVLPEGAEQPVYETLFVMERNGVRETFTVENYPYDDPSWVFVETITNVLSEGYTPPLQTFALFNQYSVDVTNDVVTNPGSQLLMIVPDLDNIARGTIMPMAELSEVARQANIPFHVVTASGVDAANEFNNLHGVFFDFLFTDRTTLLTMSRANPGLMLLHQGTVAAKWNQNNLPGTYLVSNPLSYAISSLGKERNWLLIITHVMFLILMPYLILTLERRNKTTNEK